MGGYLHRPIHCTFDPEGVEAGEVRMRDEVRLTQYFDVKVKGSVSNSELPEAQACKISGAM